MSKTSAVNVTSSDQKMISDFSKRHIKIKELNTELKIYADMQEKLKDCTDSLAELELEGDDFPVK